MNRHVRALLLACGVNPQRTKRAILQWSLSAAGRQQGLTALLPRLRQIEPDLRQQYSRPMTEFEPLQELKLRTQHAFQCLLMLQALRVTGEGAATVVDIGDSAGTHMKYLSALTEGRLTVNALSVNLDQRAVDKIRARGGRAITARAEELVLDEGNVDLFVTFEMVEHLHNPALFFRRLATGGTGDRILFTVPYRETSQVGLSHVRRNLQIDHYAEEEHVFELSPADWTLLLLHSGWRVETSRIYRQYPTGVPLLSWLLRRMWRSTDFEGFWGAIARRDRSISDRYQDWES